MLWLRAQDLAERLPTDSRGFALLCNDVLRAFADRHEIDRSHLDFTDRINDPDGGIDGRCVSAPTAHRRLIPAANVIYQFKGGTTSKSASAVATEDIFDKTKVLEGLRSGVPFVYMAAWRRKSGFDQDIVEEVRKRDETVADNQIIFIDGYDIAGLLQSYPGVLAQHIGGISPFLSLNEWGGQAGLRNAFCSNEELDHRLRAIAQAIEGPSARVRVVGAAGNGKTRSVLEAIRRSATLDLTALYAREPDDVGHEVLDALSHAEAVDCTIVIDEASPADHERLVDRFGPMPPGVRLVTIGRDASRSPGEGVPGAFVIPGLDDTLLVEAMSLEAEGAPEEAVREAANACRGSPKLALLMADQMKRDPTLATATASLSDRNIREKLDLYLRIDINDAAWEPVAVISLLDHVGWSEELDHESATLFSAAELDVERSRTQVRSVGERHGITQKTRRLLYVSPEILADHLAIRWLEDRTSANLRKFYDALTPPLQDRLGKRLRRIAQVLDNRSSVEEVILGPEGPFRSVTDVDDNPIRSLLPRLAGPLRHATAAALRRMIGQATDEQLQAAVSGRRALVEAITELLWWEDTFHVVAPLLLRLAINENETWANNATGIWIECFQTRLGRTQADYQDRAEVLRQTARSQDPAARVLAARALGAAVGQGHSRMGVPPRDVVDAPEEAWWPKTWGEYAEAVRTYLRLIERLLSDSDQDVRLEAAKAVAEGAMNAYALPRVAETWSEVARSLAQRDYSERSTLVGRIDWVITRGRDELSSEGVKGNAEVEARIRSRLEVLEDVRRGLLGNDFSSRFRRAIEADPWQRHQDELDWEEMIQPILDQVIAEPELLESQWSWLLESEGSGPERWASALGARDRNLVFEPSLRRLAQEHARAVRWVSLYLVSRDNERDAGDLIEKRLDEFANGDGPRDWALDLLTLLPVTDERAELVVRLFEASEIAATQLPRLQFSLMLEALSAEQIARLEVAAAREPDTEVYRLGLLHYYLYRRAEEVPRLTDAALRVLNSPPTRNLRKGGHNLDYEWTEIAKHYVEAHPVEVARAALDWVEATEAYRPYGFPAVIQTAREAAGEEVFFREVTAPWLDREDTRIRLWGDDVIQPSSLLGLDPEFVVSWVAESPAMRAHSVARVLGAPMGETISPLHGRLLEEFDDEYGVGSAFFADLVTGTWTGSAAVRTRGLLDRVGRWVRDERPSVRSWAKKAVAELENMLEHDEVREEEEPFRW